MVFLLIFTINLINLNIECNLYIQLKRKPDRLKYKLEYNKEGFK